MEMKDMWIDLWCVSVVDRESGTDREKSDQHVHMKTPHETSSFVCTLQFRFALALGQTT